MTGYDTAGRIQNTYVSAHREFGTHPNFWIRYFTPSPAADLFHEDAVAESRGAWDSGGPYIGVISAPKQSRLSGSAAEGHADAQAFAAALLTAYHGVRRSCCQPTTSSTAGSTRNIRPRSAQVTGMRGRVTWQIMILPAWALSRCTRAFTVPRIRRTPIARPSPRREE